MKKKPAISASHAQSRMKELCESLGDTLQSKSKSQRDGFDSLYKQA